MQYPLIRAMAFAGMAATLFVAHPAAAQVLQRYNTGAWVIEANARNGDFQNCTATGSYGGGASVVFMLTRTLTWGIAINNPQWNWRPGSQGQMNYWVDGGAVRRGAVNAMSQSRLLVLLADSTSLFNEIRVGQRMYFRPDGHGVFNMTLRGTSVALGELLACVRKYR